MTQPAPGVQTGVQRDHEGRLKHHALAVTKTGVEYRSTGLSGPCPTCGLRFLYCLPAHHIPTHKGPPCVAPGDLVYCPKCNACAVIGDDLGLTPCPDPTDPDAAIAHRNCIAQCKAAYPALYAKPKPAPPPPASSPAQAFSGVGSRKPTTTNRPTRDSERRDIA